MPFVVGITPNSLQEVFTLPMEEVLMVDVDKNMFLQKPAFVDDYLLLPDEFWTPLVRAIKEASKNIKSSFSFPNLISPQKFFFSNSFFRNLQQNNKN